MNNEYSNVNIPIPTETSLFSEDGEIDPELKWRWWFKLPDIWTTSNIGEKIVGIRSIYLMKNRRKIEYTLHLKKYKYTKTETAEMIDEKTVNELTVRMVSWLPVDKDLREFYVDMFAQVNAAIEENNKTKTPQQIAFEMNNTDVYRRDIQMDGVFEKYQNRRSFVEKIYCPNEYPSEIIEGTTSPGSESLGTTYFTKCMFKITDVNEDFDLIFNINNNPLPEDYVTEMNFFDVWDRHSCKVFSNIASDSNRGYVGNSQIVFMPIKYFKINSTDKKFYIDFYNSRNIKCPSVLPYKKKEDGSTLNEPFVIELQLMQNEKLLYI